MARSDHIEKMCSGIILTDSLMHIAHRHSTLGTLGSLFLIAGAPGESLEVTVKNDVDPGS